jgi:hypothetical protein
LANFLSKSPNQTKFLSSVCPVPGLDLSAIPVSISAVSLGRLSTYILLDFKFAIWAAFSLTHMFHFNIHDSNIATADYLAISAETACWEIERK